MAQARGKKGGVFFNGKMSTKSHDITYKLLSSQHKRKVNDVIMSFFLTAPRSHGPSGREEDHTSSRLGT
jgi:hypothetical protein